MAVEITGNPLWGGYLDLGTTPNAPRVVFCTPNTLVGPSGTNRGGNIRITGEGVYALGASVVVGTVRGHGHFENLGRLLRLSQDLWPKVRQFTSKAELVHLAPTRAYVLLAT